MKLVENWRQAWKWISVQVAVIAGALQAAMLAFPTMKDWLSEEVAHAIGLILIVAIVLGRVVDQKKPSDE